MAIISKIRRYSTVAIAFIAFSIVAFVLSDLLGQGGILDALGGNKQYVGTMAGEWISVQDFEKAVKIQTQGAQEAQGREMVWNSMLFDKVTLPECELLGITVTDEESKQMVQGDSIFIHPYIRSQFTDQKTQKFDKNRVIETLQNMGRTTQDANKWKTYEDGLRKDRMRTKYENLMRISVYVTKAEAEREHEAQNAKAEVKYVYVPFTSIPDSTIAKQVKEADMQDYLNKNPKKFKVQESRSLEYIVVDVKPSKEDSTKFAEELRNLAKEFAITKDDSSFARSNSDTPNPEDNKFITPDKLPAELFRKYPAPMKGQPLGPLLDGKTYKILKVSDIKKDSTNFMARASHILFKADKNANDETKAKARKEAEEVLAKIKDGGNFEELAKKHGSDGTAQSGGDLGWFGKGRMVKPFEDAVFNAPEGLVPNLVITDFGYHILKVTYAKTNIQYKVNTVSRNLEPSDNSTERALAEARSIAEKCKTTEELRAFVKKNPKYILQKAEKLAPQATSLNALQNAREPIRWAFTNAKVGEVSQPMELKDQNVYLVATLTAKTEKDELSINALREELKNEILKQIKTKTITAKLDTKAKTLDDIAKKYGKEALTGTANDLSMSKNDVQGSGFNPTSVGKAMGLKAGKRSDIIVDDSGIFIVEMVKSNPAPAVADYTQYKNTLKQSKVGASSFFVNEALKKYRKVEDLRYKIY